MAQLKSTLITGNLTVTGVVNAATFLGHAASATKTANAITFNNGGSGVASGTTFNGSTARTVSYNTIGAAPTNHASSATTYGAATTSNYGHVKIQTGDMNGTTNTTGIAAGLGHTHSNYALPGRLGTTQTSSNNNPTESGFYYYLDTTNGTVFGTQGQAATLVSAYNNTWAGQIGISYYEDIIAFRRKENSSTWGAWMEIAKKSAIPTKVSQLTNDSNFTSNTGTVTSVRVQAGTGLSSSVSTAQTSSLNTTISIASGYKLPTTTEWSNVISKSAAGITDATTTGSGAAWIYLGGGASGWASGGTYIQHNSQGSSSKNIITLPNGNGTLALTSDIPKWWRTTTGIRSNMGTTKDIQYSGKLYSIDTSLMASTKNGYPSIGDYILDPYGSIWVVLASTTTQCTAIQRWMSTTSWEVCLEEGTLITMADKTQKPIEEVQIGDLIMGYDFENNKPTEAVAMFAGQAQRDEKTTYVLFSNGEILSLTDGHTLYCKNYGRYIAINDLKEGDIVLGKDGEDVEILAIHWNMYEFGHKQFYHITSSNNTYFANNILNAEHPIDRYNWIVNRMNLQLPKELLEIIKEDSKEYDCMSFTIKNNTFVKEGLQYQYLIKKTTNEIDSLKRYLCDTDYIALKYAEGKEIDTSIIIERQKYRDEINKLQEKLLGAQNKYNNLLEKYSDLGADILLSDNERRSKYFKLACKRDNENLEVFKQYCKGEYYNV